MFHYGFWKFEEETDTKTDTRFPTLGELDVIGTNPPTTR